MRIFLLIMAFALHGCLGVGLGYTKRIHVESPRFGDFRFDRMHSNSSLPAPTTQDVAAQWGAPTECERINEHDQRWVYAWDNLRWNGVGVMILIVPIPLLIPVGHEHVTLTFRDNQLVSADYTLQGEKSVAYGVLLGVCGPYWGSRIK